MNYKSLKDITWEEKTYVPNNVKMLVQEYDISDLLARLLDQRGISSKEILSFLNPKVKDVIPDPLHFIDMEKGVQYVSDSIINNKKICIYGDYDVDGATSSALLKNYFGDIGVDVIFYIPDRIKDGYGPNIKVFEMLRTKKNVDLLIVVDCGSTSHKEIDYANSIGLKVIILDHHICNNIPNAVAVINPNRIDESTKYKFLAAVGVSFLFLCGLNSHLNKLSYFSNKNKPNLLYYLDLVALGTVCDVMKLDSLNRAFIYQGLNVIKKRLNSGLNALIDISGISGSISAQDLGFSIGPRINAAGRIGDSSLGAKILSCNNDLQAKKLSIELNSYNSERKDIESLVLLEAMKQLEDSNIKLFNYVYSDNWHPGVIGIVASRLKENFNRPSFVLSIDGDYAKCSARSVAGINLSDLIESAKSNHLIVEGGGHPMACGFTIHKNKLEDLRLFFSKEFLKLDTTNIQKHVKKYDISLSLSGINNNLYQDIKSIEPFGVGNDRPIVKIHSINITNIKLLSKKHLSFWIGSNSNTIKNTSIHGMIYNIANTKLSNYLLNQYKKEDDIFIIANIIENHWKGRVTLMALVQDICVV